MDYHLKDELGGECSNNIRRISILGKEDRHRTEVAVKGVKPSNGLIENTVMFLHGIIRTTNCHIESSTKEELREDSPVLPCLVKYAGSILSRCLKGRGGR